MLLNDSIAQWTRHNTKCGCLQGCRVFVFLLKFGPECQVSAPCFNASISNTYVPAINTQMILLKSLGVHGPDLQAKSKVRATTPHVEHKPTHKVKTHPRAPECQFI
jgi:hypothetical protein